MLNPDEIVSSRGCRRLRHWFLGLCSFDSLGIGRLGLCFALSLERIGLHVLGIDQNEKYVRSIQSLSFSSEEPGVTEALQKSKCFETSCDFMKCVSAKMLFIFVQTPTTGGEKFYDHTFLSEVLMRLVHACRLV